MAVFKCKMCGGALEINDGVTVATCEYCGTKQTLPRLGDDRKANLFDRANHFRRNNEFDKAMGIYEQLLNEDTTDAESYWSIVLCRYGIEYVEDPSSRKRIPTVNRVQFTSVFDDEDYKSAIRYADNYQREIYEAEAASINDIQKNILAISQKEDPFDVFICYKETDNAGRRTQDSVLATELYHELTKEGFKVFFSRITLEDKLGIAYEPYIFAALNSSKVMVALGTKAEHFNAVWVKNEWSRYLALIKNGANKILIPAYRDMDPYDLPEEFSHLQAQDMSKLGFMQDLVRGIKKLVETEVTSAPRETVVVQGGFSGNMSALVKRGFLALEDEEWDKADDFFEQALNQNAEDAESYLGKLMAELCVSTKDDLKNCDEPFDDMNNYQKAIRFGDEKFRKTLEGYIAHIKTRNEEARLNGIYIDAKKHMNAATTEEQYKEAARKFDFIKGYKDADALAKECYEKAEIVKKNLILANGKVKMKLHTVDNFKGAIELFKTIPGWKDADKMVVICQSKIEEMVSSQKDSILAKGKAKMKLNTSNSYNDAIGLFKTIPGWKDADEMLAICKQKIEELKHAENDLFLAKGKEQMKHNTLPFYRDALRFFELIPGWKDADEMLSICKQKIKELETIEEAERKERAAREEIARQEAAKRAKRKKILIAAAVLLVIVGIIVGYSIHINNSYNEAVGMLEKAEYEAALTIFEDISFAGKSKEAIYNKATELLGNGDIQNGILLFSKISDYSDSAEIIRNEVNKNGCEIISSGEWFLAALKNDGTALGAAGNMKDVISVSAGYSHTVGLKKDGTVVATDRHGNKYGQSNVGDWKDIIAVSAGFEHTVGLRIDGTVVAVGKQAGGRCKVSEWTDIVAISAGTWHTVGLRKDGTVVAVGNNTYGQCDVSSWENIVSIEAGDKNTFGITADGSVVAVGDNEYGKNAVGNWRDIVAVSSGAWHTVGLKSDGSVVATGSDFYEKCELDEFNDIVAIEAGAKETVLVTVEGNVICVGDPNFSKDISWNLFR